jgi:hypothetical protein
MAWYLFAASKGGRMKNIEKRPMHGLCCKKKKKKLVNDGECVANTICTVTPPLLSCCLFVFVGTKY